MRPFYEGKRAMVTGGLGFIGSNLAIRLLELGASVLVVDSLIPETGANLFNIEPVQDHPRLSVRTVDVRDVLAMQRLVRGQSSHLQPGRPGQPHRLDAGSVYRPGDQLPQSAGAARSVPPQRAEAKVIFASTRQIYGRVPEEQLPVDERQPPDPVDVNGINKLAGERYHVLYNNVYGIRTSVLRLTNTYGPRMLVKNNRQTALGWLIRQAMDGEEITIFGDGAQLRDFTYVDDVVEAFLMAGASDAANGQVFNLGGIEPISLRERGRAADRGRRHGAATAWCRSRPSARRSTSARSTSTIARSGASWGGSRGSTCAKASARTVDFYRAHRDQYWAASPRPAATA